MMREYKFFYPNGEEIKEGRPLKERSEAFIDFYNRMYYYFCSQYIEDQIDDILKNDIQEVDIVHILAWKMDKIRHRDSEEKQEFVYHKSAPGKDNGWQNCENYYSGKPTDCDKWEELTVNTRAVHNIKLGEIAHWIIDPKNKIKNKIRENNDPIKSLEMLNDGINKGNSDPRNGYLSTVYLITLLYFITGGNFPIYDQFAAKSIEAIKAGKLPNDVTIDDKLEANFDAFKANKENIYIKFKEDIEEVFTIEEYKKSRNIDRALWVYGHLFTQAKSKK